MMCVQAEAILLHAIIVAPLNETRVMAFFHMILLSPLLIIIITAATTFFEVEEPGRIGSREQELVVLGAENLPRLPMSSSVD